MPDNKILHNIQTLPTLNFIKISKLDRFLKRLDFLDF